MKLRIVSVGHKMPAWVETACAEYTKRMPRELSYRHHRNQARQTGRWQKQCGGARGRGQAHLRGGGQGLFGGVRRARARSDDAYSWPKKLQRFGKAWGVM
jgi:hypothetical protein